MFRKILIAALLVLPGLAHAEWRRAESTNFIVYSDGEEADLRRRIIALEKFGSVLQAMTGARRPKEVPVKITVYFVRDTQDVVDSMPYPVPGVAGYYSTTMRGPYAVMPRKDAGNTPGSLVRGPELKAWTILQHELTHHFMFHYFPAAYPAWYTEGFADYMGALEIDEHDVVKVGLFLDDRALALRQADWVPLKTLMNPRPGKDRFSRFAYYSQGWILVHYLNSSDALRAKLRDYLREINKGASFGDALKVFGDIDAFDAAVHKYATQRKLPATATQYSALDPGPVTIAPLPPAEQALVEVQMRMSSGIAKAKADGFARRVRGIAERFPDSDYATALLVDAERLANNRDEATAAVDRWLAKHPANGWAQFHKGELEIEALAAAKSTDAAAWTAARQRIIKASKALPNQPRILRGYYDSYRKQGVLPPAAAQNALVEALDLIPFESNLRHAVALDYENRGMLDDAIGTIAPLAYGIVDEDEKQRRRREKMEAEYAVAGDEDIETPREMLVRLEKKKAEGAKPAAEAPAS